MERIESATCETWNGRRSLRKRFLGVHSTVFEIVTSASPRLGGDPALTLMQGGVRSDASDAIVPPYARHTQLAPLASMLQAASETAREDNGGRCVRVMRAMTRCDLADAGGDTGDARRTAERFARVGGAPLRCGTDQRVAHIAARSVRRSAT
jgi:hypothetical protein